MHKNRISRMLILILITACLLIYYFIFNIYEVTYSVEPAELYADNYSKVVIKTVPVNSTGNKVPFRNSFTRFKITEGKDLVDIVIENNSKGQLVLKVKDLSGTVAVHLKSEHAILPSTIEINIYPNPDFIKDKGVKNL